MSEPVEVRYPSGESVTVKLIPAPEGSVLCRGCVFRPVRNCAKIKDLPSCVEQVKNHIFEEVVCE